MKYRNNNNSFCPNCRLLFGSLHALGLSVITYESAEKSSRSCLRSRDIIEQIDVIDRRDIRLNGDMMWNRDVNIAMATTYRLARQRGHVIGRQISSLRDFFDKRRRTPSIDHSQNHSTFASATGDGVLSFSSLTL
jgi:hypothetical protein